jgi:hypothetical protein
MLKIINNVCLSKSLRMNRTKKTVAIFASLLLVSSIGCCGAVWEPGYGWDNITPAPTPSPTPVIPELSGVIVLAVLGLSALVVCCWRVYRCKKR